jgi:hypothetical protein
MQKVYQIKTLLFVCIAISAGCQANINSNVSNSVAPVTNAANASRNANTANLNVNANAAANDNAATIDTREPETYSATFTLKAETSGETQPPNLPQIAAQIARDGDKRRVEISLPTGEKVVYLDADGKHFLIFPSRKQFAEINQESTGFQVRDLMTPGQIVRQAKKLKGVRQAGEENFNGRTAIKYVYAGTTNTGTNAGQINTESVFLVDKETGLPLRAEIASQSDNANVKGVSGVRVVSETSNIQTVVAADAFAEPGADYKKIESEQVKAQIQTITNAVLLVAGNILQNAQTAASPK